jgi:hypothetical protein
VFADRGGAAAARPAEGTAVSYTTEAGEKAEVSFAPLAEKFILDAEWAKRLSDPKVDGAVEFASASGWKLMTTSYLYTVLEVPRDGYYHVDFTKRCMRELDLYIGGRLVVPQSRIALRKGRYPVMLRAAIGTVKSHEKLYWYLRLKALTEREAEQGVKPMAPEPLAKLPPDLDAPVAPLILGALPYRMLGAWPIRGDLGANPYKQMTGLNGALIQQGTRVTVGSETVTFRPLPDGAIDNGAGRSPVEKMAFNVNIGKFWQGGAIESLGLSEKDLFAGRTPAAGLFFAVLANRRSLCVQAVGKPGVRCWLSGQECTTDRPIRLKPGFYPYLIAYRAEKAADRRVLPVRFHEVPDPDVEVERWRARVVRNADFLRRIAASGEKGTYATKALEAVATEFAP